METTTLAPTGTSAAVTTTNDAQTVIGSDFETFLKMLTVQMQNQDPLNPMESTEFATQLATFSSVEQQVLTNNLLTSLVSGMTSNDLGQVAGWIGREARAAMPAYYDGAIIPLSFDAPSEAEQAEIIVSDANGTELERFAVDPATGSAGWTGYAADGTQRPAGTYAFTLVSYQTAESGDLYEIGREQVQVYANVQEVRMNGGETQLVLPGNVTIAAGEVTALRQP